MHICVGKLSNLTVVYENRALNLKIHKSETICNKCLTNGYSMSVILKIRNPCTKYIGAMFKSVLVAMCKRQLWPPYAHALVIMAPWLNLCTLGSQDACQGTIQFKTRPIFGCYIY